MSPPTLKATLQRALDLKPFPRAAQEALVLVMSRDWRPGEVEQVIRTDPGLASRVLRMANSPLFSPPHPVDSIRRGLVLLGGRTVRDLLVLAAMQGMFTDPRGSDVLDHCVGVSSVLRVLADLGVPVTDAVISAGLLHDVGALLLLQAGAREPDPLRGPDLAHKAERAELGFDHAMLGAHALRAWGIPDPVPGLVGWHHDVDEARKRFGPAVRGLLLLRTADALEHHLAQHEEAGDLTRLAEAVDEPTLSRAFQVLSGRRVQVEGGEPRVYRWR